MADYPATPTLDKIAEINEDEKRAIINFVEWMLDHGYCLAKWGDRGRLVATFLGVEELLYRFYGIDSQEAEIERGKVLAWVRDQKQALP